MSALGNRPCMSSQYRPHEEAAMLRKPNARVTRRKSPHPAAAILRRRCLLEPLEPRLCLAVFTVDTTADTVDVYPGDGIAADVDGHTSLRAAVMEANASQQSTNGAMHDIQLPVGIYHLTIAEDPDAPGAASGDLDIAYPIRIFGDSAQRSVIDAGGETGIRDRVFSVHPRAGLVAYNLIITGGWTSPEDPNGGGVLNEGVLIIERSVITGNSAAGAGGGVYSTFNVGEIVSTTSLTVVNSTISNNTAAGSGGGVFHLASNLGIVENTLSGNTAGEDGGGSSSETAKTKLSSRTSPCLEISPNETVAACFQAGASKYGCCMPRSRTTERTMRGEASTRRFHPPCRIPSWQRTSRAKSMMTSAETFCCAAAI